MQVSVRLVAFAKNEAIILKIKSSEGGRDYGLILTRRLSYRFVDGKLKEVSPK